MKFMLIVGALALVAVAVAFFALRDHAIAAEAKKELAVNSQDYAAQQKAWLVENLKKPGWKATPSGLQYHVIKAVKEAAPKPAPGSVVKVNYEGKLTNGEVFDSSYARKEPISFPLNGVIEGWGEGVPMMKVGEVWEFAIPSELAYGPEGGGPIPGGSTLIFKIELLEAKTPA
jgi:FKBP-type peptidyl-prolyl cis-trans isomerase